MFYIMSDQFVDGVTRDGAIFKFACSLKKRTSQGYLLKTRLINFYCVLNYFFELKVL